jgi:hypothetical protein
MLAVTEVDNFLARLDKKQKRELFSELLRHNCNAKEISDSLEALTPSAFFVLMRGIGLYIDRHNL